MFFQNRNTRCYCWRKTGKKRARGNEKNSKKNRYLTEPYLYEFVANKSSFGIYTRKTKEILFENWNLITSSKYLTFNILREYRVACCVFFTVVLIFELIFIKKISGFFWSVFVGFFCRNLITLRCNLMD
jgi:hypothetical protein